MSSAPCDELALFHRTLAELTRQELPLPKAFRLLAADIRKGKLKAAAEEMAGETESGVPLAEAYGRRKDTFPKLYRALIEAGQAAGDIPGVLTEIAEHAKTRALAARRLRRALAYPVVTALFVVFVGGGALLFAAPRLWRLPTGRGSVEFGWFEFSAPWMLLIAVAFVGIFVVGTFLLSKWFSPMDRPPGFTAPVFGRIRLDSVRASFASAMAMLLRRKTPLPKACELVSGMFEERPVKDRVVEMTVAARKGESLREALGKSKLLPPSVLWLVENAEGNDGAAAALDDIATIYRNRLDRGLDRMEVLVTPMAELVIGIAVFFFAYSYLMPMFKYTKALFGGPY